jgi:thiamine biosynthesis lipoprotein
MASELQLVAVTGDDHAGSDFWNGTLELLDRLEASWSRFLPHSDVTRLNHGHGRPVDVDASTITLIDAMIRSWHLTDHRFDPTTLRALTDAGYSASVLDPRLVTVLPSGDLRFEDAAGGQPTMDDIAVSGHAIRLPAGMTIDAGGIGKGLAADLAVAHALDSGADGAMANIGGDVAMGGRPPDGGWTIHVEYPLPDDGLVGTIAVSAGGVATSSTRSRRWWHEGAEQHHVIDPWTGAPSTTDLWSVTVVARSGWLAEAHATAALLAGSDHVIDYLDSNALSGVAVADDGRVVATEDLSQLERSSSTAPTSGVLR